MNMVWLHISRFVEKLQSFAYQANVEDARIMEKKKQQSEFVFCFLCDIFGDNKTKSLGITHEIINLKPNTAYELS